MKHLVNNTIKVSNFVCDILDFLINPIINIIYYCLNKFIIKLVVKQMLNYNRNAYIDYSYCWLLIWTKVAIKKTDVLVYFF